MSESLRVFFRKGMIDVVFYLSSVEEAGYYEIYRQGFVVSRQTFADLLRLLEEEGLVNRRVTDSRPPRVNYSLSEKGRRISSILKSLDEALQ